MVPLDPEAVQVTLRVVDVLERLDVPYHVGGSYASAIHGVPRQTHDVDIVVDLTPASAKEIAIALDREFYVDEQSAARAVRDRSSFNLIHLATGVKVDLFVKGASAFDRAEFDRRVVVPMGEDSPRDVFVKSAEDTVLRKLLWFRLGGEVSDRQWDDVRGIVRLQGDRLDRTYLTGWADRLGVRDLWDRLATES
jgi:Aminoglycoside-2''-adenylyltransferase